MAEEQEFLAGKWDDSWTLNSYEEKKIPTAYLV
jgi:hypothetical protein